MSKAKLLAVMLVGVLGASVFAQKNDLAGDPLPNGVLARAGTTRWYHSGPVYFTGFTADGKTLVTASQDGQFYLWEVATGKELAKFKNPGNPAANPRGLNFLPSSVDLSAEGVLAVGCQDGTVRLFDVATSQETQTLRKAGQAGVGAEVLFSPDGETLVTKAGNLVRSWEVASGEELKKFGKQNDARLNRGFGGNGGHSLAFSQEGEVLVSAGIEIDPKTRIQQAVASFWNLETGEEIRQIKGPQNAGIATVAMSSDGKTLAWASFANQAITLYEVDSGNQLRQLVPQGTLATMLQFSPDGNLLAARGNDQTIRLLDVKSGKEVRRIGEASFNARQFNRYGAGFAFSPDGKVLAEGSADNKVRLWEVATGKGLPLAGHQGAVASTFLSPDGKTLTTRGSDSTVRQWDAATGKELRQFVLEGGGTSGVFSPDGSKLAVAANDNTVRIWDVASGKELHKLGSQAAGFQRGVTYMVLAFSPDGKTLATRSIDQMFRLWDVASGALIKEISEQGGNTNYNGIIAGIAFSPDGGTIATVTAGNVPANSSGIRVPAASAGGVVRLWKVSTGKQLRLFQAQQRGINALAFAPDGRSVITANADNSVSICETVSGMERFRISVTVKGTAQVPRLRVGGQNIYAIANSSLAISADGTLLALALGQEPTVRIYDLNSGDELGQVQGHRDGITSLTFSADGQKLISGSADTTALVWDLSSLSRPKPAKPEELTEDEAKAFWTALAEDAGKAHKAIKALSGDPKRTLPLLAEHLKPAAPTNARKIAQLVDNLDSEEFGTRQKAAEELEKLGEAAEPALTRVLTGQPTVEVRQRIDQLLNKLQTGKALPPDVLQTLRAVEVLEKLRTAEAKELLEKLSKGSPEDRLTQHARLALDRLARPTP